MLSIHIQIPSILLNVLSPYKLYGYTFKNRVFYVDSLLKGFSFQERKEAVAKVVSL